MISQKSVLDACGITGKLLPYEPPNPSQIISTLIELLEYETETSFLRSIEGKFGLDPETCEIKFQEIFREATNKSENIKCLILPNEGILQYKEATIEIWQGWMNFEMLDFFRIIDVNNKTGFLYDSPNGKGFYFN